MNLKDLRKGDVVLVEAEVTLTPSDIDRDIYLRADYQNLVVAPEKVRLLRPVLTVGETVDYAGHRGESVGVIKAVSEDRVWIEDSGFHEVVDIAMVSRRPLTQPAPEPAPAL